MLVSTPAYLLRLLGLSIDPLQSLYPQSSLKFNPEAACTRLQQLEFSNLNTVILDASYYTQSTEVETLGACAPTARVRDRLCRVQFMVITSNISALTAEMWLPSNWSGRFLALGNSGIGGCIDYDNLAYGSSLGFASVGSNNGHDGETGISFANNSEVLLDFTSRSIHTEALVGKEINMQYYEHEPHHSYYMGCSTGGRQGLYSALHHPTDFDGVLAGAPATNWNHLVGWGAMLTKHSIPPELWNVIAAEVTAQCDGLDGVVDGIITEPDACDFRPEALLCEGRDIGEGQCLSLQQVEALRRIYSPLYGLNGDFLFPRFDPGAEAGPFTKTLFNGKPHFVSHDWFKYVVHNNKEFNYDKLGLADIELAKDIDPGYISTFNGDFSTFRDRGGKIIAYHGRADDLIASDSAKEFYNLVSRTLFSRPKTLDEFYRLFLIPGMGHCTGGRGAVRFGQHAFATIPQHSLHENHVETFRDSNSRAAGKAPTNVLLALVHWVETGNAPDEIVGVSDDGLTKRAHCRYPMKSQWDGADWACVKD